MLEQISDADDDMAELYLEGKEISEELIRKAIRRATLTFSIVPVLAGNCLQEQRRSTPY